MRKFSFLLCLLASLSAFGQTVFTENFDDGSIIDGPIWEGDVLAFDASSGELVLNAPGVTDTSAVAVAVTMGDSTVWEMKIRLDNFSPTNSNNLRIWLSANQANLKNAPSGYFLRLGENGADDAVNLYKQNGSASPALLVNGTLGTVATTPVAVCIRITRNASNLWTLETDYTCSANFTQEFSFQETGTPIPTGGYFGFFAKYTASNNGLFGFDDLQISPIFVDNDPPEIIDFTLTSSSTAEIRFNEPVDLLTSENIGNYTWDNGISTATAARDGSDFSLVRLGVSPAFISGTNYTVNVANVEDLNQNAIPTGMPLMESELYVETVLPEPFDLIINEIMADGTDLPGLPNDADYMELYNRSSNYIDLIDLSIADANNSWKQLPTKILAPAEYITLLSTSDEADFTALGIDVLGVTSFPALNKDGDLVQIRRNLDSLIIHAVDYQDQWDLEDGKQSMERKNQEILCREDDNWVPGLNTALGGTPSMVNSFYEFIPDTIPPTVDSNAVQVDPQTVLVYFDEALDETSATSPLNYDFGALGNPTNAVLVPPNAVELRFGSPVFVSNVTYTIIISNVKDCDGGNPVAVSEASFTFYITEFAEQYDILINEIMSDPSATPILPLGVEYVELYNRSDKAIQLSDFSFADASVSSMLPDYIFPPNSYITLCDDGDTTVLSPFGDVLGYAGFPSSLSNNGEWLRLKDETNGLVIDSLTYADDWDCGDGSCSMERKNPNLLCQEQGNWAPSTDSTGGTPSRENTGFVTTINMQAPSVIPPTLADGQTVLIEFDRYLDQATATDIGNYSIGGFGMPDSISMPTPSSVLLYYSSSVFVNGNTYTVDIDNVEACSYPGSETTQTTFTYYIVATPKQYDILINEIMADPNPEPIGLPAMEYIELYNRTDSVFNLKGMRLDDKDLPFYLLLPDQYVVIHSEDSTFDASVPAISLSSFPSISNAEDLIELQGENGDLINAVYFTDDCYAEEGKGDGGWSLERVNSNKPCDQCSNWRASHDIRGGTPGAVNSAAEFDQDEVLPDLVKVFPLSDTTVRLSFSEAMDRDIASIASNYSIVPGNITAISASVTGPLDLSVILSLDSPLELGTIYTLTVEMGDDCVGNPIGMFDNKPVALPEAIVTGDLIINEILYNPVTGGKDFVELLNRSDKVIAMNDLTLAKFNEEAQIAFLEPVSLECLLFPGEYVALTEDPLQVLAQYETPNPAGVLYADLPSYDDDMGDVILLWGENVVDLFHYEDDYGFPLLDDKNGVSLERIDPAAPTNVPSNWHSAAESVGYATPAYKNSQDGALTSQSGNEVSLETNVLSPDSDGHQDFLIINYNLDQPGFVANVNIYDAKGRLVKELVKNELLDPQGFFKWDGDTDYSEKARLGIYVIFTELFSADGRKSQFKHSCVVAGQL